MSKLKDKAKQAIMEGTSLEKLVSAETRELAGKDGGLNVLMSSTRGGADGNIGGGYPGRRLQFPWSPRIIDLLCRAHEPVAQGCPKWVSIIAEDLEGGYLVAFSIRRLSESYQIVDENGDPQTIRTCFGSRDEAPSHFKGGNDKEGLLNFLAYLNGRPIRITEIKTIDRNINGQSFAQKIWDYKVEETVPEDTLIWALEHWDQLSREQKVITAGAVSAAGVSADKIEEVTEEK